MEDSPLSTRRQGAFVVTAEDGAAVRAEAVVLAVGAFAGLSPAAAFGLRGRPHVCSNEDPTSLWAEETNTGRSTLARFASGHATRVGVQLSWLHTNRNPCETIRTMDFR